MKCYVQVLIKPRWSEFRQRIALSSALISFRSEIIKINNLRYAEGRPGLCTSRLAEYNEISRWLSDKYIELRGAYEIRLDYFQFEKVMLGKSPVGDEWRINYCHRIGSGGCPYRNGRSYVKNINHLPKSGQTTNAWYIHNHHRRDKGRRSRSNSARKYWVKQQARDHRAWVKQQIHSENWDAFERFRQGSEYKINRWLWD